MWKTVVSGECECAELLKQWITVGLIELTNDLELILYKNTYNFFKFFYWLADVVMKEICY